MAKTIHEDEVLLFVWSLFEEVLIRIILYTRALYVWCICNWTLYIDATTVKKAAHRVLLKLLNEKIYIT